MRRIEKVRTTEHIGEMVGISPISTNSLEFKPSGNAAMFGCGVICLGMRINVHTDPLKTPHGVTKKKKEKVNVWEIYILPCNEENLALLAILIGREV